MLDIEPQGAVGSPLTVQLYDSTLETASVIRLFLDAIYQPGNLCEGYHLADNLRYERSVALIDFAKKYECAGIIHNCSRSMLRVSSLPCPHRTIAIALQTGRLDLAVGVTASGHRYDSDDAVGEAYFRLFGMVSSEYRAVYSTGRAFENFSTNSSQGGMVLDQGDRQCPTVSLQFQANMEALAGEIQALLYLFS